MSNYHFNINFKQKCKADSRQILKLDNLRSASTTTFQPKGIEHILIKRMCDGQLKQQDLLHQLFSKKSSKAELSKQKGFYYEDRREVASVKEFFHFYKLVSSEKNNIQRQEFNEQLQKKTDKIIHILHEKNQVYKERQQTLTDDIPIKSLRTLPNQSLKDIMSSSNQNYNKNIEHAISQTKMSSVEFNSLSKKPSLDNKIAQPHKLLQRKSSQKPSTKSQRRIVPLTDAGDDDIKPYFMSQVPSIRAIRKSEEIGATIATSPSGIQSQFPALSNISSQQINNVSIRMTTSQNQTSQISPKLTACTVSSTGQVVLPINERNNRHFGQQAQYKIRDLNLSELSQTKVQGSTLHSNTASRRCTNQIPTSNRSNQQPQQLSMRSQSAKQENINQTPPPLISNLYNQETTGNVLTSASNNQNGIEFQNSKIQQLLSDFNDSVLEFDHNSGQEHSSHQTQVLPHPPQMDQSEIQNNQSQKSIFLKGVSRNNSIASQPYFDFPASQQYLKDMKNEKSHAFVSFSLPQSELKDKQPENKIYLESKYQPKSMGNLQLATSLNESQTSIPRTRLKSYSPNKEGVSNSVKEFNFEDENENEKEESVKQFLYERQKSLQFTMKQADKFLHSHDSLAGTKAHVQQPNNKLKYMNKIFKSATNFDIIISNSIDQSIERKKKLISSGKSSSIVSKISPTESPQKDKIKDFLLNSQYTFKEGHDNQENDAIQAEGGATITIESENDMTSSINLKTRKGRVSSDIIMRPRSKIEKVYNENIEEVQEDQDEQPKQALLNVQKLKQENLVLKGDNKMDIKAIKNLNEDITSNIQKIDSLLANKVGQNMFLDQKRIHSPLSYTQKQFHTRAEVVRFYDVQKYFDIQKTIAIDYSNAKKNIALQQFDTKIYTKNTDFVKLFH